VKTLAVAVAARTGPSGRSAVAAVVRSPDGAKRTVVRRVRPADPVPPVWRALLLGLWAGRRAGARALALAVEEADVVAALERRSGPPAGGVVPYLQARALLNAFQSVEVRLALPADPDLGAAAAAAAGDPGPGGVTALPLWSAAAASRAPGQPSAASSRSSAA
jgi:hypothetical protein